MAGVRCHINKFGYGVHCTSHLARAPKAILGVKRKAPKVLVELLMSDVQDVILRSQHTGLNWILGTANAFLK